MSVVTSFVCPALALLDITTALGFILMTLWPLAFLAAPAGASPPFDGLELVENMGLAPRGSNGTQIPLCTGATGGPPTPPLPARANDWTGIPDGR